MFKLEHILGSVEKLGIWGFIVRTLIVGIFIYFMTKLLPRRSGGQYSAFDFTFFWLLGGLVVSPLASSKVPVINMVVSVITIYFWHYVHSFFVVKSRLMARILVGRPSILIENGRILKDRMSKNLFNIEMLMSQMRFMRVANPNQISYAVLETNGQLSILKNSSSQPVTPNDLNIPVTKTLMPVVLINDGKIIYENLKGINWDFDKLKNELAKKGVQSEHVYLATIDAVGELYYSIK